MRTRTTPTPMTALARKRNGAYYTPGSVVSSLVRWAVRASEDRLLDPACGDGRFIAFHHNSVGIEQDVRSVEQAVERAPHAPVHHEDFFAWAARTKERFDCTVGNPPFIRYQTFKGASRRRALDLCASLGARFSGLTSSWAPFLVATASLLKRGGRMAFVVPAELGHAPYAAPLIEYFVGHFSVVQIVAVREKLFPDLSEDCWLLYADGFGGATSELRFSVRDRFEPSAKPTRSGISVSVADWRQSWNRRLRPYLLPRSVRDGYLEASSDADAARFGDIASIGIGYVTGANDFFHLRPSETSAWDIPSNLLCPTVRNSRLLPARQLTRRTVNRWRRTDEAMLLLKIPKNVDLPSSVEKYLETDQGKEARKAYKCRTRSPWYSVPHVQIPDFFLTYMSGIAPSLVRNSARVACTNAVHCVHIRQKEACRRLLDAWATPFVLLSCELEGHPLGGGVLKLEPGEANRIVLPSPKRPSFLSDGDTGAAISTMRSWRHHANA